MATAWRRGRRRYTGFAMTTGDYENGEYKIAVVGKDDRGGSRYAMSPLKGA
jgi:hypothetical protein